MLQIRKLTATALVGVFQKISTLVLNLGAKHGLNAQNSKALLGFPYKIYRCLDLPFKQSDQKQFPLVSEMFPTQHFA